MTSAAIRILAMICTHGGDDGAVRVFPYWCGQSRAAQMRAWRALVSLDAAGLIDRVRRNGRLTHARLTLAGKVVCGLKPTTADMQPRTTPGAWQIDPRWIVAGSLFAWRNEAVRVRRAIRDIRQKRQVTT